MGMVSGKAALRAGSQRLVLRVGVVAKWPSDDPCDDVNQVPSCAMLVVSLSMPATPGTSSFITGMVPLSRTACECHVLPILPIAQSGAAVCLRGVRLYTFRKRAFAILRSIARYCFLKSAYSVSRGMGNAYGNACSHFAGFQPGRRIQ